MNTISNHRKKAAFLSIHRILVLILLLLITVKYHSSSSKPRTSARGEEKRHSEVLADQNSELKWKEDNGQCAAVREIERRHQEEDQEWEWELQQEMDLLLQQGVKSIQHTIHSTLPLPTLNGNLFLLNPPSCSSPYCLPPLRRALVP